MEQENAGTGQRNEFSTQDLEKVLPNERLRENFLHLLSHLDADHAATVALKGHLVIEEKMTSAITKFVFHSSYLEDGRLTFAQKLALCRAISTDQNENSMWDLIAKLNKLRNALSHSLEGASRAKAMEGVRTAYLTQVGRNLHEYESNDESLLLAGVIAMCLGFLDAHEQEIERFKDYVKFLDKVVNPHRHAEPRQIQD
jgi:hypothetical protein